MSRLPVWALSPGAVGGGLARPPPPRSPRRLRWAPTVALSSSGAAGVAAAPYLGKGVPAPRASRESGRPWGPAAAAGWRWGGLPEAPPAPPCAAVGGSPSCGLARETPNGGILSRPNTGVLPLARARDRHVQRLWTSSAFASEPQPFAPPLPARGLKATLSTDRSGETCGGLHPKKVF